jgi:dTDP-4-amino-4,6-dideoxygalactose transaminase
MEELGLNYRLSDLQAALGLSQLARLPAFQARRRELVERYLGELEGFELPVDAAGHAWHLFVIPGGADERDALMEFLAARGIGTQVHYYPVPHQPYFRRRYGEPSCPAALRHARTCLSLPLHARLTDDEQAYVIESLRAWRRR